jgi:hypothetical protein
VVKTGYWVVKTGLMDSNNRDFRWLKQGFPVVKTEVLGGKNRDNFILYFYSIL